MNILGISGSLRKSSMNTALLRALAELASPQHELEIHTLEEIPMYNGDIDAESGAPNPVLALADAIRGSDAVVISSPEYNYSIPGVLKNTIDWLSRVPNQPFKRKPTAIIGTSPGSLGTGRMQYHLRQVFVFLDANVINKPEVMVGLYTGKFDETLALTDEKTKEILKSMLDSLEQTTTGNYN